MHVIVARCLQTQSILNRLTIEQWSTIEKKSVLCYVTKFHTV